MLKFPELSVLPVYDTVSSFIIRIEAWFRKAAPSAAVTFPVTVAPIRSMTMSCVKVSPAVPTRVTSPSIGSAIRKFLDSVGW